MEGGKPYFHMDIVDGIGNFPGHFLKRRLPVEEDDGGSYYEEGRPTLDPIHGQISACDCRRWRKIAKRLETDSKHHWRYPNFSICPDLYFHFQNTRSFYSRLLNIKDVINYKGVFDTHFVCFRNTRMHLISTNHKAKKTKNGSLLFETWIITDIISFFLSIILFQ